jgi:hypothetical protein
MTVAPRYSVRMVETTILAHHEAVFRKRGWSIPSLEIEPPIVQGLLTLYYWWLNHKGEQDMSEKATTRPSGKIPTGNR